MRIRRSLYLCSALIAFAPALAAAQEARKVGIAIAYPTSVGILWHASDKIAIRPELTFGGSSTNTTSASFSIDGSGWNIGTGVSALFFLHTYDRLRTYITPRFSYGHASTTTNSSGVTTTNSTQTSNTYGGSGAFGAQYALGDRFSLVGELGFGFTHATITSSPLGTTGSGNAWGTRAGVGVVFYP